MKFAEEIREAVAAAKKADDPGTAHLAHVEAGQVPAKWLKHVTETPSGKTYGVLTLGAAEKWLASLGIKLVVDQSGRALRTYNVEVRISGYHHVTVEAYDENEAIEAAEVMAQDDAYLDYEAEIVDEAIGTRLGAA